MAQRRAEEEPGSGFVDLSTRAHRVGQWVWLERTYFELLGRWAGTAHGAPSIVFLGEMSRRHGWHAGVFFERLPELATMPAEDLVTAPGPATLSLLSAIDPAGHEAASAADAGPEVTVRRMVAAHRVLLPLLLAGYRDAMDSVSDVAEPSLRRWLDIVVRDDLDEWLRGEQLLRSLLVDSDVVEVAARHQLELELLVVPTAGLTR